MYSFLASIQDRLIAIELSKAIDAAQNNTRVLFSRTDTYNLYKLVLLND